MGAALFSAGPPGSDQNHRTADESLIRTLLYRCFLAEPTSLIKKQKLKGENAIDTVCHQTQWNSKSYFIRICA